MAGTMTRYAFEKFCKEHIEWLKEKEPNDTLERRWVVQILEEAPRRYYDQCEPVRPFCD